MAIQLQALDTSDNTWKEYGRGRSSIETRCRVVKDGKPHKWADGDTEFNLVSQPMIVRTSWRHETLCLGTKRIEED